MEFIKCKCLQFFNNVESFLAHCQDTNHIEKNTYYECQLSDCGRRYGILKPFRLHLRNVHQVKQIQPRRIPVFKEISSPEIISPESLADLNIEKNFHENIDSEKTISNDLICDKNLFDEHINVCIAEDSTDTNIDSRNSAEFGIFDRLFKDSVSHLLTKFHAEYNVPRNCVQQIISDLQTFFNSQAISFFQNKVLDLLGEAQSDEGNLKLVETMFEILKNPFSELDTEFKRMKNLKRNSKFVTPIDVTIGYEDKKKTKCGKTIIERVNVVHQYFPIALTLKNFFEMESVFETVVQYTEFLENVENKEVISHFIQGKLWKKMKSNYEGKRVIPLFLYIDDFEVNGPLSAHAGCSGKMCGIYMNMPLLPMEFLGKVDNIFIVQIFQSLDRKIYGNKMVFRKIINDLIDLAENGIDIETKHGTEKVYFLMGLLKGDNLGLNEALGFTTCFISSHYCRTCEMPKEICRRSTKELEIYIRNPISYDKALLDRDPKKTHSMGIVESSIWNELPYFHVTTNMMHDLLHDWFENTVKHELGNVLYYYVHKVKILNEFTINDRLEAFEYGENCKRNRPLEVPPRQLLKCREIKMSSSEIICLIRHLGLLIGDLIPENDPVWEVYITLSELTCLLLKTTYHKSSIELLETLIRDHLELFMNVFSLSLKPTQHFMTHYPRMIRENGPVVKIWTMREEHKHQISKKIASKCQSRVNIAKTISITHSVKNCDYVSKNLVNTATLKLGPIQAVNIETVKNYHNFRTQLDNSILTKVHYCKWVEYHGDIYKKNCILKVYDPDEVVFFEIIDIYLDDNKEVFCVTNPIEEIIYDRHFQAYQIISENINYYHILYLKDTDGVASKNKSSNGNSYICCR